MSDKVFISGLRAETVIGVYDWERTYASPWFLILKWRRMLKPRPKMTT